MERSTQRNALTVIAGLGIGAAFLPWFRNPYNSVSGFETEGVIIHRIQAWVESIAAAAANDERVSGAAGCLDWIATSIQVFAGTAGDGLLTSTLFGVTLLVTFLGRQSRRLSIIGTLVAITPAVLAGAAGTWTIMTFNTYVSQLMLTDETVWEYLLYANVQVGVGLYAVVLAAAATVVTAFAIRR